MQRLVEAEREQLALTQAESFSGITENEILLFRNQLKVGSYFFLMLIIFIWSFQFYISKFLRIDQQHRYTYTHMHEARSVLP